jgi:geranylgeranyl diphosphate synthase type I
MTFVSGIPAVQPAATAPRELARLRARIDASLAQFMDRRRAQYLAQPLFAPLYEDLQKFVSRPGKRLRSLIFLLAHGFFARDEEASEADLLGIGVCLELLHGFILIHDDIIDRSDVRRASPTLHRLIEKRLPAFMDRGRVGRNLALVLGDILFALAQSSLVESGLPAEVRMRLSAWLLQCIVDTGFGEVADVLHGTRDVAKVSLADIEQMYLLKTTRYTLECPMAMAAIVAGYGDDELDALARFARPAGLAFQIQNDLQEFERFEVSDADVSPDMIEGKKTLLMRAAFELLDEPDRGLLQLCFSAPLSEGTLSKARELIAKSGALALQRQRMDDLFAEADHEARQSGFDASVQDGLISLSRLVREATARC